MKLITWNARRHTVASALECLKSLEPDIVVLCEVAGSFVHDDWQIQKIGETELGVALAVRPGYSLSPHATNGSAPLIAGGFVVSGPVQLNLVAAWPVKSDGWSSYHKILMQTLEQYGSFLANGRSILAGDLNSNSTVSGQERSHPEFVAAAQRIGLVSAYHEQTGEAHGQESLPTYRHGQANPKWFHLDYCFVSRELMGASQIRILKDPT